MEGLRRCSKCGAKTLALRRKRLSLMGMTRHFRCTSCGHEASVGTWGNLAINLAIAFVVIPGVLYLQHRTLDTVPIGAIGAVLALVALSGFEVWRLRRFEATSPPA